MVLQGGRLLLVRVTLVCTLLGLGVGASTASASPSGIAQERAVSSQAAVCDTGNVFFAKTKFVFHAGLAFGVFHRYIYKPFKAGAFRSGSSGRLTAAVKAALAAAFVYHELKLACKDAQNSSVLRPLLIPLTALVGTFTALEAKLKSGKFSDATFKSAASAVDGLGMKSSGLGLSIPDIVSGFTGG